MSIEVRLPDDSLRQLPEGATGADLAGGIGARLLEAALAVKVDGRTIASPFTSTGACAPAPGRGCDQPLLPSASLRATTASASMP